MIDPAEAADASVRLFPSETATLGRSHDQDAPRIAGIAWRRGIGVPCESVGHARVATSMVDDGEWAGVPIGGLGTGSIGRTFRGDFARWHLEVGTHRFTPSAVDGFTVHVGGADGQSARTTWLSALRPDDLPAAIDALRPGQGTYQALFPRAWQVFDADDVGIPLVGEQLSPVIAGDLDASALPVGVFEWWLENPATQARAVGVLLTWEAPRDRDGVLAAGGRQEARESEEAASVVFHAGPDAPTGLQGTFAIAARREPGVSVAVRAGLDRTELAGVRAEFAATGTVAHGDSAPSTSRAAADHDIAAVAVTTTLAAGERRAIRFSIAWDFPVVEFGAGRRWWKRYTRDWGRTGDRAVELAHRALVATPTWRRAIEAWQGPYFADPGRPEWYVMALFNELYFLVDGGSFWEHGEVGGAEPQRTDPGRFALLECVDYPFYDTVDVDFYASFALLQLYPELEQRGIRDLLEAIPVDDAELVTIEASGAYAARKVGGTVPHDVGGPADDPFVRPNWYRFQDVNDWKDLGPKFVLQLWRDAVAARGASAGLAGSGDDLIVDGWPIVDAVMSRLATFDRDGDGLPEHDGVPDQTYDTWPMRGPSAYGGSLWLAALAAATAMAGRLGLDERARHWAEWLERAQASYERRLWRGDHYAYDDGGGPSSDSIMADQLAGQWYADATGLGDLLPTERIDDALRTIHRMNVVGFAGGRMGPVNGMRPDGTVDRSSEQSSEVWIGTAYALAAFMIGRGLDREGWDTARGVVATTYERGLWFRTPEAFDADGNFRATIYLRPLAVWAIEDSLRRRRTT
ncbi:MAG: non-lysosomal glucosylceramidase [Chloroflexota bacterium]|nr:non-lysosomal glucosylceramidase [Chloroflexota bacterium]